jgi:hypothetical protein
MSIDDSGTRLGCKRRLNICLGFACPRKSSDLNQDIARHRSKKIARNLLLLCLPCRKGWIWYFFIISFLGRFDDELFLRRRYGHQNDSRRSRSIGQLMRKSRLWYHENNSIDIVQLYDCGAQGTSHLYPEDITITACIRLLIVFYIDSE